MITNRIDLLVTLINDDKENVEEVFDKLVPKYQAELYTLYNILTGAKILTSCELSLPEINDDILSVQVEVGKSNSTDMIKFIDDNDGTFIPFKKSKEITIEYTKNKLGVLLIFKD